MSHNRTKQRRGREPRPLSECALAALTALRRPTVPKNPAPRAAAPAAELVPDRTRVLTAWSMPGIRTAADSDAWLRRQREQAAAEQAPTSAERLEPAAFRAVPVPPPVAVLPLHQPRPTVADDDPTCQMDVRALRTAARQYGAGPVPQWQAPLMPAKSRGHLCMDELARQDGQGPDAWASEVYIGRHRGAPETIGAAA